MKQVSKVVVVETRPIREGTSRGNVNARPSGTKPVASAKPEGRPVSSSGNGASQGSSPAQVSSQKK
jgi:hypothetical protein